MIKESILSISDMYKIENFELSQENQDLMLKYNDELNNIIKKLIE